MHACAMIERGHQKEALRCSKMEASRALRESSQDGTMQRGVAIHQGVDIVGRPQKHVPQVHHGRVSRQSIDQESNGTDRSLKKHIVRAGATTKGLRLGDIQRFFLT